MRVHHLIGLLLWRGGLLLAGGTVVFLGARFVLRFLDIPLGIEIGLALLVAGAALVLLSLILERVADLRAERGNP